MSTIHKIIYDSASNMKDIPKESVALVVTSPPYPMIEMWNEIFSSQDSYIDEALKNKQYDIAFYKMHEILNKVWSEVNRILIPGGIACINIGDATKTHNDIFRLYSNHSRIINYFEKMGFYVLPDIIWRKQTNAPNKFMGSGMYPPGAYVTFEHEYILIFRKGDKRQFKGDAEKDNRHKSAYFWEERNIWFSDVWELRGTTQNLKSKNTRERSGAFPFELVYRLINMYSVKGDTVVDPFLGTGTTVLAAISSERNSIGYEIDEGISTIIQGNIENSLDPINSYIEKRIQKHKAFVEMELEKGKSFYNSKYHDFNVKTKQEIEVEIKKLKKILFSNNEALVEYEDINPILG